jgi:Major tropism determinant N-terminal domain
MASCTRNARFELRRNISGNWASINPILLAGEPGVELDTGQMKVGDGVTRWNQLPYVGNSEGLTGPTGPTGVRGTAFYYGTDLNNPQGPIPNPSIGDVFLNTETGQLYVKLS